MVVGEVDLVGPHGQRRAIPYALALASVSSAGELPVDVRFAGLRLMMSKFAELPICRCSPSSSGCRLIAHHAVRRPARTGIICAVRVLENHGHARVEDILARGAVCSPSVRDRGSCRELAVSSREDVPLLSCRSRFHRDQGQDAALVDDHLEIVDGVEHAARSTTRREAPVRPVVRSSMPRQPAVASGALSVTDGVAGMALIGMRRRCEEQASHLRVVDVNSWGSAALHIATSQCGRRLGRWPSRSEDGEERPTQAARAD